MPWDDGSLKLVLGAGDVMPVPDGVMDRKGPEPIMLTIEHEPLVGSSSFLVNKTMREAAGSKLRGSNVFEAVARKLHDEKLSIEEAKVVFIFDAPDATVTLPAYGRLLAKGLLKKRRLTEMVDWDEAAKFVDGL